MLALLFFSWMTNLSPTPMLFSIRVMSTLSEFEWLMYIAVTAVRVLLFSRI
jgi:hypothetical protein